MQLLDIKEQPVGTKEAKRRKKQAGILHDNPVSLYMCIFTHVKTYVCMCVMKCKCMKSVKYIGFIFIYTCMRMFVAEIFLWHDVTFWLVPDRHFMEPKHYIVMHFATIYMYVCVFDIYIYIYIYIHTHTQTHHITEQEALEQQKKEKEVQSTTPDYAAGLVNSAVCIQTV